MEQRTLRLQQTASGLCRAMVFLGMSGGLAGCGSIEPVAPHEAPITDPTQLYTLLTLNHPAVTLSTAAGYATLPLTATPRDALGNPMTGLPAPTFRSLDTSAVRVTDAGLVTAVATATEVLVIAELTVGPVTHADTARIQVTDLASPPVLASLSIEPVPPDSAIWAWQPVAPAALTYFIFFSVAGTRLFALPTLAAPRAVDTTGSPIVGLPITYTSLDPAVATVDRLDGRVEVLRPGQARIVARTMAYGTTKADTVTYTVTQPALYDVGILPGATGAPTFAPTLGVKGLPPVTRDIRLAPYGIIAWYNHFSDTVDITFDDPTQVITPPPVVCDHSLLAVVLPFACGVGDMLLPGAQAPLSVENISMTARLRQFPEPGVYPFRSTRLGISGRVIVTTDPDGDPPVVP